MQSSGTASSTNGPEQNTVYGLGNRKNAEVQRRIAEAGVRVFEGSRRYLQAAQAAGLRRFVVSSSANTGLVLRVTGLDRTSDARVSGAQSPILSSVRPRPDHPEWDTAVWLDMGTLPVTPGFEGNKAREGRANLSRLVALYEAWGRPEKAAPYRAPRRLAPL